MRHVLHLIKDPANQAALGVLAQQARDPEVRVSVVLMQNAAGLAHHLPGRVFRLDERRSNGGSSPYPPITHAQLLDLIFTADTVVAW